MQNSSAGSDIAAHEDTGRIGSCANCNQELPLRLPGPRQQGTAWVCIGCGAKYSGIFDPSASPELARHVRPAALSFDRSRLIQPPQTIAAFIQRMKADDSPEADRRRAPRHEVVSPVAVVPVDGGFHPIGSPFLAVTRDLSASGIALLHTRAVESELLVVELPTPAGQVMQVAMRVTRCQSVGRFYEIAGSFIVRMA
jgi:hypothetical protein